MKDEEQNWTPGEWYVAGGTTRVLAKLPTGEVLVIADGPDGYGIVKVTPRHRADARLIASAPKLYAALKRLHKQARKLEGEGFTGAEIEQARAALSLVEEKQ